MDTHDSVDLRPLHAGALLERRVYLIMLNGGSGEEKNGGPEWRSFELMFSRMNGKFLVISMC